MWLRFWCLFFQNVRHSICRANLVSNSCCNCLKRLLQLLHAKFFVFLNDPNSFLKLGYSITNTRIHFSILSIIYTFSKELGEGYRTLKTHLPPMFYYLWRNHVFNSHLKNLAKATVGKWYFKKRCKSMPCIFT